MRKSGHLVPAFESGNQAMHYDTWFSAKVREAMTSARPRFPHLEAMAQVNARLAEKRAARAGPSMG